MNEVKFKANIKDLASLQAAVSEIPEIPTPATTDEGKVLTVSVDSSGETPVAEYGLAAPASGLPAIASGDAGKVLTVNAGETAAEWAAPSGGLTVYDIYYSLEIHTDDNYLTAQLPELSGTLYWYVSGYDYQPFKDTSLTQKYSLEEFIALINAERTGRGLIHLHEMSASPYKISTASDTYVDTSLSTPLAEHDYISYLIGEPVQQADGIGYTAEIKEGNT